MQIENGRFKKRVPLYATCKSVRGIVPEYPVQL